MLGFLAPLAQHSANTINKDVQWGGGGYGFALFKMLCALVLIAVLGYVVVRFLRRQTGGAMFPQPEAHRYIRVLDRQALSPRQHLWMVEAGGRFFLLLSSESGAAKIAELESLVPTHTDRSPSFRSFLEVFLKAKSSDKFKMDDSKTVDSK